MRYLIFVLALCVSSAAWAGCKTRDLQGIYIFYTSGDRPGNPNPAVCDIEIAVDGKIVPGLLSCIGDFRTAITGGKLKISDSCVITGTIKSTTSGVKGKTDLQASMSQKRNLISGVFINKSGRAVNLFTAVKHDGEPLSP